MTSHRINDCSTGIERQSSSHPDSTRGRDGYPDSYLVFTRTVIDLMAYDIIYEAYFAMHCNIVQVLMSHGADYVTAALTILSSFWTQASSTTVIVIFTFKALKYTFLVC